ncbi:Stealth CR1 domain-containing protein [Kitasatospora sp. NPDC094015]|uniref:Stealth CR1 domain-containing protein n=1 Tax=Kitasatospora sp. NPDC094015 TaxID=3155205 RepID=UPI00332C8AD3
MREPMLWQSDQGPARPSPPRAGWVGRLTRRAAAPTPRRPPQPPSAAQLLLAAEPALVVDRGLLAEVRDDLTPAGARAANLELACAALRAGGVRYALVPDARRPEEPERHHVAVPAERRGAALRALEEACAGRHVYLEPVGWGPGPGPLLAPGLRAAVGRQEAGAADEPEQRLVRGVRVFRPVVTGSRTVRYGPEQGCEVKFWQPAGPGGGRLVPYGDSRAGWWVPSLEPAGTVRVAGRRHPVPAAFARRLIDDVDFPIDAVYTWVDDTDPRWRAERARRAAAGGGSGGGGGPAGPPPGSEPQRFRNRDELRYSLRSLALYAPWIRRVHLVTDEQVPAWLAAEHPGLTVVSHRALFGDPAVLPVFNSRAIESQLHRIEGLSEHFVYFNDDVFLGRELGPGFFFQSNGAARIFQDGVIPPDAPRPGEDTYVAGQKNTRDAVARRYGRSPTRTLSHAPRAAHRSLLRRNARRFAAELARTAAEPFRGHRSLSPLTLYGYTAYLEGRAVFAEPDERFVDIGDPAALAGLSELLERRDAAVFCLNDVTTGVVDPVRQDAAVRAFLEGYFPVAGPFERPPVRLPRPAAAGREEGGGGVASGRG